MNNNSLVIVSDVHIHQDPAGRFSINDLYKASGSHSRNKPSNWLRLQQTIDLIEEIKMAQKRAIFKNQQLIDYTPVFKSQGIGTYVCRELVIAYAAWISAAFHLKVIRVFLDHQDCNRQPSSNLTNEQQEIINALLQQLANAAEQTREYERILCLLRGIAGSAQLVSENLHDLCVPRHMHPTPPQPALPRRF